ncbi:B12-binding domain-containing radical SAM protein [Desulfovibrio sp. TomC]|uniref:B12-binding domain-containing radical SAM protein n=1 Tax=Desulfovibrio sp. TomC TaxID=1562888 RepID=UPI000575008E|nr:radical SAM protein [Desulfovibrio sp. TomC]KHK02173.1 Radical SAM domain protein [Desulfovibrio sp. TomC]
MPNIILINPSPNAQATGLNESSVWPPVGLASIAAVLVAQGYATCLIDNNLERMSVDEVLERTPKDALLIGVSLNSFAYDSVRKLCELFWTKRPGTVVVLGGPLPSVAPELVLDNFACNGVVRGEGEESLLHLVRNIVARRPLFEGVSGAAWKDQATGTLCANPVKRITDLDALPFPAYHLLPPLSRYKSRSRKRPIAPLVTSRGCAHGCSFCSKDIFQRKVTFHSPHSVLSQIDWLIKEFGVRQLDILDDNFAMDRKRMEAILDGIIERGYNLAINLNVGIRSEGLDENIFQKMKKAGVFKVAFGIESADPGVLELCNKKLNIAVLSRAIAMARRMGFIVYGFFIIGLPGETEEAFRRTMRFAKDVKLDIANFCLAVPFVGTELYRQVERNGKFLVDTRRDLNQGFYSGAVFFEYPGFTKEDILRRYKAAYKHFYTPWKQLVQLSKMRSVSELLWYMETGFLVLRNMVFASAKSK